MLTKRHYLSIFLSNNIYHSLNFPFEVVRRQKEYILSCIPKGTEDP